jgi:small subunit ribosomal protein S6
MAYKINKSDIWFYILYELNMDWKKIKDLSKTINLNKNIWRYMFVKKDD